MTHAVGPSLDRLRTATAGTDARDAVVKAIEHRGRPMSVRVTGRAGVGKSAVLAILRTADLGTAGFTVETSETGGIDVPSAENPILDADVLVYVLAGSAAPADLAVLTPRPAGPGDNIVVVLSKADTFDDPAVMAAQLSATLGRRVLPVMSTIAAALCTGSRPVLADVRAVASARPSPSDFLTVDRLHNADLPLSTQQREALIDCIELWGLARIVGVLQERPTATDLELLTLLADASGAQELIAAVDLGLTAARTTRDSEMHRLLTDISGLHRRSRTAIETYLATDDAVIAEMHCAAALLGVHIQETPGAARAQAISWQKRASAATDPATRRAAIALCRGYIRMHHR